MAFQSWVQTIAEAYAAGPPLSATVTQASIIPTDAKATIPAKSLRVGSKLRMRASGQVSCVVTTPGTLTFQVLVGAAGVFSPAAFNLNVVAKTNVTWWLDIELTVRSLGSGTAATIIGTAQFVSEAIVSASAGQPLTLLLPASAPAVGTGFDSTIANTIDLQAKFSVATAGTAMTLTQYSLESLN